MGFWWELDDYVCADGILRRCLNLKFKNNLLMSAQLTDFLLKLTFEARQKGSETQTQAPVQEDFQSFSSHQILTLIHSTLNEQRNYKATRNHRMSLSSEDTTPQSPLKCNCKKSKCLKLYCECFSKGSFCKDCNCECCQNTEEYGEVRAKAIDEMMSKSSLSFRHKASSIKGCNCKKTGCQKKYCECFSQGVKCTQLCKCNNCENSHS